MYSQCVWPLPTASALNSSFFLFSPDLCFVLAFENETSDFVIIVVASVVECGDRVGVRSKWFQLCVICS